MDNSSTSASQKTNAAAAFDDKYVISFGSLTINGAGPVVPSSSPEVPSGDCGQLQESRPEEESSPKMSLFPPLESSQEISLFPDFPQASPELFWFADLPTSQEVSNPQRNIWAAPPIYNGGIPTPGCSFYPPNACQFAPVAVDHRMLWGNSTNFGQRHYEYANPAWESPGSLPVYIQPPESFLQGFDFLEMAKSPESSEQLRRILLKGKFVRETMSAVLPSIIQLMSDDHGHRIFEILLEKSESYDLYAMVKTVTTETESFVEAALCETGSRSIQRFIKKLKNTGLESIMTLLLSKYAWRFMINKIASHIIRQCFLVLGDKPNRVLHDCVFQNFPDLATEPVGCITVNDCIDGITGFRRAELLNLVAHHASFLSNDPSGNFVVQHVLDLQNEFINRRICVALKDQFVQLSQKKGGSHVVEKCLKSSIGLSLALGEIFRDERTLLLLARDQFGNYVVQTALKETMIQDKDMYKRMVEVLEPRHSKIVQKVKAYFANLKLKGADVPDIE